MFAKRRNCNKITSKEKSSLVIYITKTELEMHFIVIIIKSNLHLSNFHFIQWTVLSNFPAHLQLSIVCLTTATISEICAMSQYKTNIHSCRQPGFLWPATTVSQKHYHVTLLCSCHSYRSLALILGEKNCFKFRKSCTCS